MTGLRERKKLQTTQQLATVALRLSAHRGFENVTVDAIADAANVSKRTFFRFYPSKESAVLATEQELFDAVRQEAGRRPPAGPVLRFCREALVAALDGLDDEWFDRWAVAGRLVRETPALEAVSLQHCASVNAAVLNLVTAQLDGQDEIAPSLRLALDATVAAWRLAVDRWLAAGAPDRGALRDQVGAAMDLVAQLDGARFGG
ncbi:TetR family transcriptional regulator [Paractinoplanes maris]|uniref:TetR family transcriptional regulator n=1 Tax=Paractinoplanes maris TaxID=1734446 RepID=UPI00202068F5|nr:TetR family transcriptional regulator [Actinoplanes maris]